ncbi:MULTISPECIES: EstA family serine hydrolase [Acinetobacter]|uniref:EstA family serine hydrolase n=1 Tax=Acinetobacter TaxID=469 RepID=UPI0002AEB8E5|nr:MULTISPECIES: EstA family serine hydrolase [Acinetobacter]ELW76807.1 beta-lactamase [Acinetobacter sp. WC-743]MBJ8426092.1 EstA family serine hydrolase [Acinetobacter bereziniae]MBJ8475080.1 EstA family serine hydrolase [Acinetobacter bereziniae]
MKLFSTNTCFVPKDLGSITSNKNEVHPELGGMTVKQVDKIWQSIEHLYQTGNHPLISVCLRRKGQIILNRSLGHASGNSADGLAKNAVIANPDTPICLFSASKMITAILIHMLDETGEINLLDPISHYIPEYAQNGKRRATIFHLLSHRGGIPRIEMQVTPELLFDKDQILQYLYAAQPISPAGSHLAYHAVTAGYILGELIERVTGQDLRQFLHEKIEKPMNMPFFNYGLKPEYRDQVALNYPTGVHPKLGTDLYLNHVLGGGLQLAVDVTNDPRFMDTVCPAGNIYTSAEQANRFFEMLLNGGEYQGKRIMSPETVFRATLPTSTTNIDRTLLAPMRYALGPMLGSNPLGIFGPMTGQAFGHLGFSNILCWADPQRDISVSILNTGKAVMGTHIPALAQTLYQISNNCPKIPKAQRRAVFGTDRTETELV